MGNFTFALDIPTGLNSDDTGYAAKGRWADGNNIRFQPPGPTGRPQAIGEFDQLTSGGLTGIVRNLFALDRGAVTIAAGTETKLYVGSPTSLQDRTPVGIPGEGAWSFGAWGTTLLAVQRGGRLYQQTGTSTATEVTEAPDSIEIMIVTPERRQVIVFGTNEVVSGTFNGSCIRGCDFEDYSSAGSWTPTTSNNSFEEVVAEGGNIIAALPMGGFVAVWTEDALYLGSFVGDPEQTYRWDLVAKGCGAAGKDAVTTLSGRAYWVGADLQFRQWAPGELPRIIPCPIRRQFITSLTRANQQKIHAGTISKFDEVWFNYDDGEAYVCLNTIDGAWSRGDAAMTAMCDSGLIFDRLSGDGYYTSVIGAQNPGGANHLFAREIIVGAEDGPTSWHVQSADQYIDEGRRRVMVSSVTPDVEDQAGDLTLTLYVRDRPQSSAATKGPYTLTTATTKKDIRVSGKLISVRIAGSSGNSNVEPTRLGRFTFDCVSKGER